MQCPACSAPISVSPGAAQTKCSYCGSTLHVQRSDGDTALIASAQMTDAIAHSSAQTKAAIGESAAVTREELRRLQLAQELSNLELRLESVQGEIRTLQRMPLDQGNKSITQQQLRQLQTQEAGLTSRIAQVNTSLHPASPVTAAAASNAASPRTEARKRGCVGWGLLIVAWVIFWPFMLAWTLIHAKYKPLRVLGYIWIALLVWWLLRGLLVSGRPPSPRSVEPKPVVLIVGQQEAGLYPPIWV